MVKMRKVEVYIIEMEFGDYDPETVEDAITSGIDRNIGDSLVRVGEITAKDIGAWSDDSIFNQIATPIEEFRKVFEES